MIPYTYADLFKQNSIEKQWLITDGNEIEITNANLFLKEPPKLEESICGKNDLTFGSAVASTFTFTIGGTTESLIGKTLTVSITLDEYSDDPFVLGTYKVYSDEPTADKTKRKVTCYDALYEMLNSDVADWYNTLLPNANSTTTIATMRSSFASHFSIPQEAAELVNDAMVVAKTIDPSELSGKDVLFALAEINGAFPHITRDNQLRWIQLGTVNDEPYEIESTEYKTIKFEDYRAKAVTKLQIRKEENDIGVIVGTGDSTYIVQDNFLVYGKGTTELTEIAENLFDVISVPWYVPANISCIGVPFLEVGDNVVIETLNKTINTYVLKRTLTGIQSLKDSITSSGPEYRDGSVNSVAKAFKQLRGKTNVLERSLEETKSIIGDVTPGETLSSMISQTATALTSEILSRQEGDQSVRDTLTQTANSLSNQIEFLQQEIDGETVLYHVTETPTLLNYPAWDFCTNIPCNNTVQLGNGVPFIYTEADYQANLRSLAYNDNSNVSYRFKKTDGQWGWIVIGDSDYTYIMQRISELEQTDEAISLSVRELSGNVYSKTETESKIQLSANGILSTVSSTYQSKTSAQTMQSQIDQQASQITAKVSKTGGTSSSFAWSLTDSAFALTSGNTQVFKCDANGITVNGYAKTNELYALSLEVSGKASISDLSAATARISNLEADHVSVSSINALNVVVNGKLSANDLSSGALSSVTIRAGSIAVSSTSGGYAAYSYLTSGEIEADKITFDRELLTLGHITINGVRHNVVMWGV